MIAALALILVGPAMLVMPLYPAAERLRERYPPLQRTLSRSIEELGRFRSCADASASVDGRQPGRLWRAHRELEDACHELGLAAFTLDHWQVFRAMAWKLPMTDGIAATYAVQHAVAEAGAEFEFSHPMCQWIDHLDGEELLGEERRSAAKVAAYRAQLEPFVPRLAEARAALERDHPLLGAMAWSLGAIEVVGWALFLVVLRQEFRAWRERRESARKDTSC